VCEERENDIEGEERETKFSRERKWMGCGRMGERGPRHGRGLKG